MVVPKPLKDLGFQTKMLPLPALQRFNYNSTISVSQYLAILMTKHCDATKYFSELIKHLQNISLECIKIQLLHSLVISNGMWWMVICKKCIQCKLILYYQE